MKQLCADTTARYNQGAPVVEFCVNLITAFRQAELEKEIAWEKTLPVTACASTDGWVQAIGYARGLQNACDICAKAFPVEWVQAVNKCS